jgi:hypothetical protein
MPRLKERELYEPIRKALEDYLSEYLGKCILENTSDGLTSAIVPCLDDFVVLYIERRKREQRPDLTGSFETDRGNKNIIIVEIKRRIQKIDDIYQAKKYAELFDVTYAFLISSEKLPETIKRLLIHKPALYTFASARVFANRQIVIATFRESDMEFDVDKDLYGGMMPEPFKTAYKIFAYLFDPGATKENLVGKRVIVRGRKAFDFETGGWVDDLVRSGRVPIGHPGMDLKAWLFERNLEFIPRLPTMEELGM